MKHGITEISVAEECLHRYAVACKPDAKEIYVVFKGTDGWRDVFTDLNVFGRPNCFEGRFHDGFYSCAKLIPLAPFLELLSRCSNYSVIFTGHSLGGAVANIVAIRMLTDMRLPKDHFDKIHCITFGAPQVCDEAGSKYVSERYAKHFHSYINQNDIVPHILSLLGNIQKAVTPVRNSMYRKLLKLIKDWFAEIMGIADQTHLSAEGMIMTNDITRDILTTDVVRATFQLVQNLGESLVPRFIPFGQHYRKLICYNIVNVIDSDPPAIIACHYVENIPATKMKDLLCRLPENIISYPKDKGSTTPSLNVDAIITSCQRHLIDNYIREIYKFIIEDIMAQQMRRWPDTTAQLSGDCSDGVLSLFSTPSTTKWKAFDREAISNSADCVWSIVRCVLDSQEELTLTLTARSVSFITDIQVEHTSYMKQPAKPEEIDTELQRVFVLYLPCERYTGRDPTADDYPIIIRGHFGSANLRGLFNPGLFSHSSGFKGRQRQIADLSIDELYRLAFTYSLFPGERSLIKSNNSKQSPATALTNCSSATDSDTLPHNQILHLLLTIEKKFQSESETIAREQFTPNSPTMIKMNQILLGLNYDDDNTVTSKNTVDFMNNVSTRRLSGSKTDESENSSHDVQVTTELVLLEDVIERWKNGHIAKYMNAIALALPKLTAMQMAFHKTLEITTNQPTWWWVKLGIAAVACSVVALAGAALLLSYAVITVVGGGTGLVASGVCTAAAVYATRHWMNQLQEEYIKILRIW
ncbi:unnamed protein product, partial [Rotaria sp. Silwood2]